MQDPTVIEYRSATFFAAFQGVYAKAEQFYERCQSIQEKVLGAEHPDLATTLSNRARLLHKQVRAFRTFQEVFLSCSADFSVHLALALARLLRLKGGALQHNGTGETSPYQATPQPPVFVRHPLTTTT